MNDLIVILRMVERITAVLIGGLAIYLGYRLFFHLPFVRDHEGQLELPGVKIVLSRVGPGVFFAAFGSMVLFYSLTEEVTFIRSIQNPIQKQQTKVDAGINTTRTENFTGISGTETSRFSVTLQQRSKALTTIEMLNCAQRLLPDEEANPDLRDYLSLAIRDAKKALMLSVWNEDDWGPADQFRATGLTDGTPFQLRSMFNATYEGCPE